MNTTLPPYTVDACCPKCGHAKVRTHYNNGEHPHWSGVSYRIETEHIVRHCERCCYQWVEAVVDPLPQRPRAGGRRRDAANEDSQPR